MYLQRRFVSVLPPSPLRGLGAMLDSPAIAFVLGAVIGAGACFALLAKPSPKGSKRRDCVSRDEYDQTVDQLYVAQAARDNEILHGMSRDKALREAEAELEAMKADED